MNNRIAHKHRQQNCRRNFYPLRRQREPDNACEIFSKPDVDGGLISGAALKADDFLAIVAGI